MNGYPSFYPRIALVAPSPVQFSKTGVEHSAWMQLLIHVPILATSVSESGCKFTIYNDGNGQKYLRTCDIKIILSMVISTLNTEQH